MKKDIFTLSIILIILMSLSIGDTVGLTSILIVTLVIFFLAKRWPSIAPILYTALAVRVLTILIGNFIPLPDAVGDAYWFEIQAYEWSLLGFPNVLYAFAGWDPTYQKDVSLSGFNSSFFISYIIAILYSLSERSVMMGQALSVLFGTLTVLMSYIISQKLWNNRIAMKAAWFVALFPSLILYSSLIMREIYFCFFLLLAINNIVDWSRTKSLKSFFLVILSFMVAMAFHGGAFVGMLAFLIIAFFIFIKKFLIKFFKGIIVLKSLVIVALMGVTITYYATNNIFIPKIGTISDFDQLKKNILKKNRVTHKGSAKYPDWVVAQTVNELIYKIPIRAIYFIFSPFPWDVKKTSHMIGMFDGFLYVFLVYLIIRNRKAIWSDPTLKIIFLILVTFLCVYGIAIANFGTGIRHRAKFIVMFILLAAPLLPKFTFSRKIE